MNNVDGSICSTLATELHNKQPRMLKLWRIHLHYMMHHAIFRGTALCGATLRPPEVKSYRIIWCVVQREHIVEIRCDVLGFKCFQRLLSMQFIQNKSFWKFYYAFYKDILHLLNTNTALKNKIKYWTKWRIFTWYPGVRFMSSYQDIYE